MIIPVLLCPEGVVSGRTPVCWLMLHIPCSYSLPRKTEKYPFYAQGAAFDDRKFSQIFSTALNLLLAIYPTSPLPQAQNYRCMKFSLQLFCVPWPVVKQLWTSSCGHLHVEVDPTLLHSASLSLQGEAGYKVGGKGRGGRKRGLRLLSNDLIKKG